jgi:biopolymer transport protein ExbB
MLPSSSHVEPHICIPVGVPPCSDRMIHPRLTDMALNPIALNPSSLKPSSLNPSSLKPSSLKPSPLKPSGSAQATQPRFANAIAASPDARDGNENHDNSDYPIKSLMSETPAALALATRTGVGPGRLDAAQPHVAGPRETKLHRTLLIRSLLIRSRLDNTRPWCTDLGTRGTDLGKSRITTVLTALAVCGLLIACAVASPPATQAEVVGRPEGKPLADFISPGLEWVDVGLPSGAGGPAPEFHGLSRVTGETLPARSLVFATPAAWVGEPREPRGLGSASPPSANTRVTRVTRVELGRQDEGLETTSDGTRSTDLLTDSTSTDTGSSEAAPPQTRSMLQMLFSGNPFGVGIVVLILLLSVLSSILIVENAISIRRRRLLPPDVMQALESALALRDTRAALMICNDIDNQCMATQVILAGLERFRSSEFGFAEYRSAVEEAGEHITGRLYRKVEILNVIASIAPMLGLTGTVIGMIDAFNTIAGKQGVAGPEDLAGGIGQALITTLLGLVVAIPTMVAFSFFRTRIDALVSEAGTRIERMMLPLGRRKSS